MGSIVQGSSCLLGSPVYTPVGLLLPLNLPSPVCIVYHAGEVLLHRNMKAAPEPFLKVIAPYREGLVVAVACMFIWYWLADFCAYEGIVFVLRPALYMK